MTAYVVIFRYRVDPTRGSKVWRWRGQTGVEENARSRRIATPTTIQMPGYLETREMGLAIWGKLPPRLAHATDLIAWLSLGLASDVHTYVWQAITCTSRRPLRLSCRGIDFLHSLFPWNSAGLIIFFYSADESRWLSARWNIHEDIICRHTRRGKCTWNQDDCYRTREIHESRYPS